MIAPAAWAAKKARALDARLHGLIVADRTAGDESNEGDGFDGDPGHVDGASDGADLHGKSAEVDTIEVPGHDLPPPPPVKRRQLGRLAQFAMAISLLGGLIGAGSITQQAISTPAEAQCFPLPSCPLPDDPDLGDVLDPILDPLIGSLGAMAQNLLGGFMEIVAAEVAEASVASLDLLWEGVSGAGRPLLSAVEPLKQEIDQVALVLLGLVVAWGLVVHGLIKRKYADAAEIFVRASFVAAGLRLTQPIFEMLIEVSDNVSVAMVSSANEEIGSWITGLSVGLVAAVAIVASPLVVVITGLFMFSVLSTLAVLHITGFLLTMMYAFSGFGVLLLVLPGTKAQASKFWTTALALAVSKIAIASSITVAALLLGSVGEADSVSGALISMSYGGIAMFSSIFQPWGVFSILWPAQAAIVSGMVKAKADVLTKVPKAAVLTGAVAAGASGASSRAVIRAARSGFPKKGGGGSSEGGGGSGGGGDDGRPDRDPKTGRYATTKTANANRRSPTKTAPAVTAKSGR